MGDKLVAVDLGGTAVALAVEVEVPRLLAAIAVHILVAPLAVGQARLPSVLLIVVAGSGGGSGW